MTERPLRWIGAHDGSPSAIGLDDEARLVAQVAFFDVVGGRGPGWVGYVRGERVTGRCRTQQIAMHSVQRWVGEKAEGVPRS